VKRSNAEYAALIMLGELSIEDVPEGRQRSVEWMVARYSPPGPVKTPVELLEHLMSELDRARYCK